MKSRYAIRTIRPVKGLVAFVRAVQMGSLGAWGAAMHEAAAASRGQHDRDEGSSHPGEGSA